jgi:hypothetical protein
MILALEENSELQRSAFIVEIDNLKKLITTHEKENEALQNLIF